MGAGARAGSGAEGGSGSHRGGVGVDATFSAAARGFNGGAVGLVRLAVVEGRLVVVTVMTTTMMMMMMMACACVRASSQSVGRSPGGGK